MTKTLYDPRFEHDACGVGMVANLNGVPRHDTINDALTILENLEHRGAVGSDVASGDGAGILIQLPHQAIQQWFSKSLQPGHYGVAQWFCPPNVEFNTLVSELDTLFHRVGLRSEGIRTVPVNEEILGEASRASQPVTIQQLLVRDSSENFNLEQSLFCARKLVELATPLYASSCSSQTLIYKGMLTATQLRDYFDDLRDGSVESAIALVHSRFSTNVLPRWDLAQPFRYIAHNGEINTVRGNRHWMRARESTLRSELLPIDINELTPIVTDDMSDSASFDEVVELLVMSGRSLAHAVLMMIPEAWERSTTMNEQRRDFYRFHSGLMEPWDGPASVTFCDGKVVGAVLDRNGLRPARYWVTRDQRVIFASEFGVLPVPASDVIEKGRLQPGRMFLVDLEQGRIIGDDEIKTDLAQRAPYGEWLASEQISLDELATPTLLSASPASIVQHQRAFGYHEEDLRLILRHMARVGEEPIGSMGSDTTLPMLSNFTRPLYDYFSQLFAQVTNPPLDAIREELVTSTRVLLGGEGNLLDESPQHCRQIVLSSPVLSAEEFAKLRYIGESPLAQGFSCVVVDGLFRADAPSPANALADAVENICDRVCAAVREGAKLVIVSDRGVGPEFAPIPSLLLTSAIHHRLVDDRLRTAAALIVETGDAREVHHVALLLGFGASAVCPYLAYESIDALVASGEIDVEGSFVARYQYAKALTKGLVKVMSKMGVSTVASYVGSQLFESVGLDDSILDAYFPGFNSRIGGVTLAHLAGDVLRAHRSAYSTMSDDQFDVENLGDYQWRREGEVHLFTPRAVQKLQHATRSKRYDIFREYSSSVNNQGRQRVTLRSLLDVTPATSPIDIDEVEPVSEIVQRFSTGAMSYGSISQEAHTTLAIAMNRLGAKSNTGEGGEDEDRFDTSDPLNNRRSSIKQVASGRFGVTSRYLVNADDIQIKMAQGAKPGEGGQLPGSKVYPWIAKTRHSTPGVGLISPPPHHDIYSIEDLAQLIYDLKNANDRARVQVKLVSEQGVGTIAAGVAKARADVILISGHDGGTGAAPLTSLKHAGTPWEIGLAEAHQTLAQNGLRSRVVLQVDGQIKTGRDVIIAALLGAEEFGFATAPLVVSGCVMMRVCHLDTCPVGIATQNPTLRSRFTGRPEFVEQFFEFIAEEVREYLALLGVRRLEDIIGDVSHVRVLSHEDPTNRVDLSALLQVTDPTQRRRLITQEHNLKSTMDFDLLDDVTSTIDRGETYYISRPVRNTNRAVGTLIGSTLTRRLGDVTLEDNRVVLDLHGSAGQSLGAFLPPGVTIQLAGDANDYVGKGLSGGRIVIRPDPASVFASEQNVIAGNVIGYGATSGEILIRGLVGERLGVRNSGATIVVEGAGDHACEYMTGGTVVALGPVGRNLAAGMSGGTLFLYDPERQTHEVLAAGVYEIDPLDAEDDEHLFKLLTHFVAETSSQVATSLLAQWRVARMHFVRIETSEYQRIRDEQRNG